MKKGLFLAVISTLIIPSISYANNCCYKPAYQHAKPVHKVHSQHRAQRQQYVQRQQRIQRQRRAYVGVGKGTIKLGGNERDARDVRLGYHLTPNVALELQHGKTTEGPDNKYTAGSVVGRTRGPLYVTGKMGYADMDFDSGVSESGLIYGAGVGVQGRSGLGAEINYTRLPDNGNNDNSYVNFGIKYRF